MQNRPISRSSMLNITIIVEALLLLLAAGWAWLIKLPLLDALHFNYIHIMYGIAAGAVMAFSAYGLFALGTSVRMFSSVRALVEELLLPLVSELKLPDILIVALISGFCEEVFFRGVVQAQFGLVITSLAFGLFHDPSFKYPSYSILAFLYGLLLGALYQYTGSLWAPIFAHITHNLISLYMLRYRIKPPAAPAA